MKDETPAAKGPQLGGPEDSVSARRVQVARWYLAGKTYAEISERVGKDFDTIRRDVEALKRQWQTEATALVGEWYGRDLAVLDAMEVEVARVVSDILETSSGVDLDRILPWHRNRLQILERRAKLLGYDKVDAPPITNQSVNINVVADGNDGDSAIRELQSLVMAVAASRTENGSPAPVIAGVGTEADP